jgi:L-asparaginase
MTKRPRVALIITGGTIGSIGKDRLDLAWYLDTGQWLGDGQLRAQVPELDTVAAVHEVPFRRVASHALVDKDWLELARTVQGLFDRDEADGVVITHGTNTLEETAYFLHLAVKSDRPVVLVGAMRPSNALSADGALNLFHAVRVAAEPASRGRGCLVVLNDTIFSARDVTKDSTSRVHAFQSRDTGPLGYADSDGKVVYYHRSERPHAVFDITGLQALPRVDVVVTYVGADGVMIEAAARAGARGIVSAGTGTGRPTPAEEAALEKCAGEHGLIVCLSSRIASGRVGRSAQSRDRGFVAGDNLPPWKARLLLSLALTKTRDTDEIQRLFDTC